MIYKFNFKVYKLEMTKLGSPIDACAMTSKVRFSRSYATCSASAAPAPSECTLIWVQCQHTLI